MSNADGRLAGERKQLPRVAVLPQTFIISLKFTKKQLLIQELNISRFFLLLQYTPVDGRNSEKCGAFNCRPDGLQGCANIRAFTAAISIWTLIVSIHFAYCTASKPFHVFEMQ